MGVYTHKSKDNSKRCTLTTRLYTNNSKDKYWLYTVTVKTIVKAIHSQQ